MARRLLFVYKYRSVIFVSCAAKKRKLEASESSASLSSAAPAAKKVKVAEEGGDTSSRQALPARYVPYVFVHKRRVRCYLSRTPISVTVVWCGVCTVNW